MSDTSSFKVDASLLLSKFSNLNYKNQNKVYRSSLRKCASIIVKAAKSNLKNVVGKGATSKKTLKATSKKERAKFGSGWSGYSLSQGIQTVSKKGNPPTVKINIMKDFRLKFFELGTAPRYVTTKKGKKAYRGSIKASHFFGSAKSSTESQVNQNLDNLISQNIQKVWNKTSKK